MKKFYVLVLFLSIFLCFSFGTNIEKFLPANADFVFVSTDMHDFNKIFLTNISKILANSKKSSSWIEVLNNNNLANSDIGLGVKFPQNYEKGRLTFTSVISFKDKKAYEEVKELILKDISKNKKMPVVKLSNFLIYSIPTYKNKNIEFAHSDKNEVILFGSAGSVKECISDYLAEKGYDIRNDKRIFSNLSDGTLKKKSILFVDFAFLKRFIDYSLKNIGKNNVKKVAFKKEDKNKRENKNPFSQMFEKFFTQENLNKFITNLGILNLKYYFIEFKDKGKFFDDREVLKMNDSKFTFIGNLLKFYKEDKNYEKVLSNVPRGYDTLLFSRFPIFKFVENLKSLLSDSFGDQMKSLINGLMGMADMQTSIYVGLTTSEIFNLLGNDFIFLSNYKGDVSSRDSWVQIFFPKDIKLVDKLVNALEGMKYKDLNIKKDKIGKYPLYVFNYKDFRVPVLVEENFFALSLSKKALENLENELESAEYGISKDILPLIKGKNLISLSYGDILNLSNSSILYKLRKGKNSDSFTLPHNITPEEMFSNYRFSYVENFNVYTKGKINKKYLSSAVDKFVDFVINKIKEKKEIKEKGAKTKQR